jgi:hypothetical protein
MKIVRTIDGTKKETTITHEWEGPGATANVSMENSTGDNSSARFNLSIEGGQVSFEKTRLGGSLEMFGGWERECFIKLLEQIIIELKLIDQK